MTLKCLIIDDEPIARKLLQEYIEETDFLVLVGTAENPLKATGLINDLAPDLIFLDINMPKMNGLEACRMIRQNNPQSEVLIVTQHDSPQMMREAGDAGARGYVVKSNIARDLVKAVQATSEHKAFGWKNDPSRSN